MADTVNAAFVYLVVLGFSFVFLGVGEEFRPKEKRPATVSPVHQEKLRLLVEEERVPGAGPQARETSRRAEHQVRLRINSELGYQSLGPFNKAFEEITGRTPRDLRQRPRSPVFSD